MQLLKLLDAIEINPPSKCISNFIICLHQSLQWDEVMHESNMHLGNFANNYSAVALALIADLLADGIILIII